VANVEGAPEGDGRAAMGTGDGKHEFILEEWG
jgi:hypothetical protein